MCFRLALVLTCSLAINTQAYAPIQWLKFPTKGLVVVPKDLDGGELPYYVVVPQELTIKDTPDSVSPITVPYFTANPDNTITWDDASLCLEAGVKDGDSVRLNHCNGKPGQQWNWISNGHGRSMIQLKDTNECLDATPGDNLGLRTCESGITESWKLGEPMPVPVSNAGMQYVMYLLAMASIGALSMGAWFWRSHGKVPAVALNQEGLSLSVENSARHGDVRMVKTETAPWEMENFEDLLKQAAKEAMPFREPEQELEAALVKVKTVEDVDAAIDKCLESGGRDLSDAVLAANKIRKNAKEDGSVTPAKPPKKKATKATDPWARKLAKTHDNAR